MADSGKDGGRLSPAERDALKARSNDIGHKLDAAKGRHAPPKATSQGSAMADALRLSTELVGGILVGSAIGYGLDHYFGTWPKLFILFFLLGSAAGMMNVVRTAMKQKTPPAPSVPFDDEDDDKLPGDKPKNDKTPRA
jgi:ATP synthase protein I